MAAAAGRRRWRRRLIGNRFYKKNCRPKKKQGGARRSRAGHAAHALRKGASRAREPSAVIAARTSAATPDARSKNKRVCHSAALADLANSTTKKKVGIIHHPDASSPPRRLVVLFRRFRGGGCGEGGVGYMGRVQRQGTSEYSVGGGKTPPTQARRRREGT